MSINAFREIEYIGLTMDKIVSYHEFLKHKTNIANYLCELFDKMPDVTVYFPNNLSSEERHLIYTNSKGYLFEKLHKIESKYSIKLWKPDSMGIITEEKEDSDIVTVKEDNDYSREIESDSDSEECYDIQEHLTTISEQLTKNNDIMLNKLDRCYRTIRRVECIFACIVGFNFVGSILMLTQVIGVTTPFPPLNVVNDF